MAQFLLPLKSIIPQFRTPPWCKVGYVSFKGFKRRKSCIMYLNASQLTWVIQMTDPTPVYCSLHSHWQHRVPSDDIATQVVLAWGFHFLNSWPLKRSYTMTKFLVGSSNSCEKKWAGKGLKVSLWLWYSFCNCTQILHYCKDAFVTAKTANSNPNNTSRFLW